eukprot:COSAG02_NODE_21694_length_778_cov_1.138439_1_plen_82_part_00
MQRGRRRHDEGSYSLIVLLAELVHRRSALAFNALCGPLVKTFVLGLLHRNPKCLKVRPLIVHYRLTVLDPVQQHTAPVMLA